MLSTYKSHNKHVEWTNQRNPWHLKRAIRKSAPEVLIAAPGTSCRQQIKDGTGTKAFHPIEILFDALK